VGSAAPGEAVSSEGGDVAGSALGVVIDARGRPLSLPASGRQRRAQLWAWLVALGAERGDSPYGEDESEPLVDLLPEAAPAPPAAPVTPAPPAAARPAEASPSGEVVRGSGTAGRRIALDELRAQESGPPPAPPAGVDSDLDALRQSVEEPKRRGLFGRKK
jgi:hypothetical protein